MYICNVYILFQNNLNLCLYKPGPITIESRCNGVQYVWLICQIYVYNSQTYTVVSAPALTKLGFYAEIQIVLGQFTLYVNRIKGYNFNCYFSETD